MKPGANVETMQPGPSLAPVPEELVTQSLPDLAPGRGRAKPGQSSLFLLPPPPAFLCVLSLDFLLLFYLRVCVYATCKQVSQSPEESVGSLKQL